MNWIVRARSVNSRLRLSTVNLERKSTRPKTVRGSMFSTSEQDQVTILRKKPISGQLKLRVY